VYILTLALGADTLRRVYAAGRTWNDHAVAAVVAGCFGFYALMHAVAPVGLGGPLWVAGVIGLWGLFFALHRRGPARGATQALAVWSQWAYAFALWGGLTWLIHLPWGLWPGRWMVLPFLLATAGWVNAFVWASEVRVHRIPGLPGRLVQLSDIHVSAVTHRDALDALVDRVNELEPDLVLITGDFVMPFSEQDHDYLKPGLARLHAPWLGCLGNHDLPVREQLVTSLGLLVDQTTEIAGFSVTGVDFHWTDAEARLREALARQPEQKGFAVLLAHDPRLGAWVTTEDFDLVLSGHTHGGQVAANMLGLPVSVLRLFGVRDQGWFGHHYVHRGNHRIGLPPRMGVASEIAVFEPLRD
jgi:predicted MPP superfamily phosphohydrolase